MGLQSVIHAFIFRTVHKQKSLVRFFMVLPDSGSGFNKADLNIDRSRELHKVEK